MALTYKQHQLVVCSIKAHGLDRKQFLYDRYEIESQRDMTYRQMDDLIKHLATLNGDQKSKKDKDFTQTYPERHMSKVQALWITLEKAGVIRKPGDRTMNKYVKRMTKKDNLKWCDGMDCDRLIEGLKAWGKREDVDFD